MSSFHGQAMKLNDSLYELHKPDAPSLQILFFHGLQADDYVNAHSSTWQSGDGSCIWPKIWLVDKYPDAHVLTVSYSASLRQGGIGMHAIAENLISDLLRENIGQTRNCPVMLVGHCFGGLVIKQLCVEALITYNLLQRDDRERARLKTFLKSIKGIYYYGTPHHGSPSMNKNSRRSLFMLLLYRSPLDSPLLTYFKTLSTETEWLNFRFHKLRGLYRIRIHGIGETIQARKGLFRGVVGAPEPSARDGDVFNLVAADHIGICRPVTKTTRSFYGLTDLIDIVLDDLTGRKRLSEEENWALAPCQPKTFLHPQRHVVPIDRATGETSRILGTVAIGLKASNSLHQKHVTAEDHAQIYGSVSQLNDSFYELHKPPGIPSMQIIFFEGLQPGDYVREHLSTRKSVDLSGIQTWLVEKYPGAQILFVSYTGANVQGSFDTEVYAGNLIADLMQKDIGKDPNCPVILVGHSFGALVINHLLLLASSLHSASVCRSKRTKLKNFLAGVRGIFYYSNPQLGSPLMTTADELLGRPSLKYFKSLTTEAKWLGGQFSRLHKENPQWVTSSLHSSNGKLRDFHPTFVESLAPTTGARETDYLVNGELTDHFTILRPMSKLDRKFYALKLLLDLMEPTQEEDRASREPRLHEELGTPEDGSF